LLNSKYGAVNLFLIHYRISGVTKKEGILYVIYYILGLLRMNRWMQQRGWQFETT